MMEEFPLITVDDLPPAIAASRLGKIGPVMLDGQAYFYTVGQILDLAGEAAPSSLNTIDKLAAAINDDPNYFQAVATAIAAVTTALSGKQPLAAMLTALAGLSGANGKFLAFSGANAPAVRDIKGAVSQSGGIPTGAIVERGSNANGEYVRFADGTQICTVSSGITFPNISTAVGNLFASSAAPLWTYPVAFASGTTPVVALADSSVNTWGAAGSISETSASLRLWNPQSQAAAQNAIASAIGRWY